jgi:hypothetical protein
VSLSSIDSFPLGIGIFNLKYGDAGVPKKCKKELRKLR